MRKLGIVVFGASHYDHHSERDNPRFLASANEFKKITTDAQIFAGFQTDTLDLYDQPISLSESLDKIIDFIGKDHDDIVVFYCGHGDVGLRDGDYRVFLRSSNRERRHSLLNIVALINDVKRLAQQRRVYFILDACYSGSAVSEMETMDFGGAEALIDRRLSEAVTDAGSGTAVLTASGRFGAALAKQEDELTLFTGAFVRCLREGLVYRTNALAFSWLDLKDEIVRVTRDRLGPDAPIPRLTSLGESASDITRTPFFCNRAFVARSEDESERTRELLYWQSIVEQSSPFVLEDFLSKFPNGTFAVPARARLIDRINELDEKELEGHLLDHPRSPALKPINQRLARLKWDRLQSEASLVELEQYVRRFPESEFKEQALGKIDRLRAEALATPLPAKQDEAPDAPLAPDSSTATAEQVQQVAPIGGSPSTADASPPPIPVSVNRKGTNRIGMIVSAVILIAGVLLFRIIFDQPPNNRTEPPRKIENLAPVNPPSKAEERNAAVVKPVERPAPPVRGFGRSVNYDMNGGDIPNSDGSIGIKWSDAATCLSSCQGVNGCIAFSFDKWNRVCFLKSSVSALILDPRSDTSIRSDQSNPGTSTNARHFCSYNNSSITAGDRLRQIQSQSAKDCEQNCQADGSCVAYTFSRSDKQCGLFRSASDREQNTNVTTGARMQNPC